MPFSRAFRIYYRLRPFLPIIMRQWMQRMRGGQIDVPDDWYLPHEVQTELGRSLFGKSIPLIHPWPDGHQAAWVLTHDVETADGMKRLLNLADLEAELGFRSVWNLVPYKYPIDPGIVRALRDRGCEIGIHGYNHDGKLFLSQSIFERRAQAINEALDKYASVGFRAPMVHRNLAWMQSLNIEYDASCFDIDPYQALPGGTGLIWPMIVGRFVELPYTLPQDHTLLIALGHDDLTLWRRKIAYLRARSGMIMALTHPDYLDTPARLDSYRQMLDELRGDDALWHALPREVATWWRERDTSNIGDDAGQMAIEGPAAHRGRLCQLSVHDDGCVQFSHTVTAVARPVPGRGERMG
ncbi:MAG: hypothetical protein KDA60_05140 [Planctomycetales bacterium]|nr:hypothetical protein [Planctomycetales bacterium]